MKAQSSREASAIGCYRISIVLGNENPAILHACLRGLRMGGVKPTDDVKNSNCGSPVIADAKPCEGVSLILPQPTAPTPGVHGGTSAYPALADKQTRLGATPAVGAGIPARSASSIALANYSDLTETRAIRGDGVPSAAQVLRAP